VAATVHDMRSVLRTQKVEMQISTDLPLLRVDPQLFHHCLINLIENAAKYGGADTPITISARRGPAGLTLSILDEGSGFPQGEEKRIFETFARIEGSDRKGGTGLGLAIVKGFAEAMGIEVQAMNRLDRSGARFDLIIPQAKLLEEVDGQ
jgi:two-component system sensor histidine kinase KdpD